ncbi:hypothetical protein [Nocardioides baculatus]|uniref:N-acetyltransferase n=1 Tax=Nocardioides baculatus TaxID=2801337 RepID=A0ABS1LA04_9ACTN|nr:hypothetical protein [Nocardioides baculatus]MBL0748525.1 hypothetical protein [Nocardioides baculatus]
MTVRAVAPELAPIRPDDVPEVGEFLATHLNPRVSPGDWAAMVVPPWPADAPNHGYLLRTGGDLVGVHLAFYSTREVHGRVERFCNLGAWCVLESHRAHGLRLLRALLRQPGYTFTDLSPSGQVVDVNRRLEFQDIDTATVLVPNLPWPVASRGASVTEDPDVLARTLTGADRVIHADHAASLAVRHLLLVAGDEHCYVAVRRDRRKNLPVFASLLHIGNRDLFARHGGLVFRHLLRRGALATLVELRLVDVRPPRSWELTSPRPKMFRSTGLAEDDIDYMYSELACVAW